MESEHLQNSDVSWGHEPGLRKSLDCRQTTFRFMESSHGFATAHRSHEHPHLTRPSSFAEAMEDKSGTRSPSEGERDGVRGIRLVTSAATVEKVHCFLATNVSRCHHQTILPSSSPSRNKSRADCGARAVRSKTFLRFAGGVAAVS